MKPPYEGKWFHSFIECDRIQSESNQLTYTNESLSGTESTLLLLHCFITSTCQAASHPRERMFRRTENVRGKLTYSGWNSVAEFHLVLGMFRQKPHSVRLNWAVLAMDGKTFKLFKSSPPFKSRCSLHHTAKEQAAHSHIYTRISHTTNTCSLSQSLFLRGQYRVFPASSHHLSNLDLQRIPDPTRRLYPHLTFLLLFFIFQVSHTTINNNNNN